MNIRTLLFLVLIITTLNCASQSLLFKNYLEVSGKFVSVLEKPAKDGFIVLLSSSGSSASDYLLEMNLNGNLNYSYNLGIGDAHFVKMILTPEQNFVYSGVTSGSTNSKCVLFKTDTLGTIIWSNKYWFQSDATFTKSFLQTSDSCFILIGKTYYDNAFIMKIDFNGTPLWGKTFHHSTSSESFESVVEDNYGNFYVIASENGLFRFNILKLDSNGNLIWSKKIKKNNTTQLLSDVKFDFDNNEIYVSGINSLMKIDSSGSLLWDKEYTYNDGNYSYLFLDSTGVFIVGNKPSVNGIYLNKFDFNGNPNISKYYALNNNLSDTINDFYLNFPYLSSDSRFLLFGRYSKLIYYNPPNSLYSSQTFVMNTDSNFSTSCNSFLNTNVITTNNTFTTDTVIYAVVNKTIQISTFNIGLLTANIADSMGCTLTYVDDLARPNNQNIIYPNPNHGYFKVVLPDSFYNSKPVIMNIYNSFGIEIFHQEFKEENDKEIIISMTTTKNTGLFILKLTTNDSCFTTKIIIE